MAHRPAVIICVLLAGASACQDSPTDLLPSSQQVATNSLADSDAYYYYQGGKVFLDLDPTRLVVAAQDPSPAIDELRSLGINTEKSEALPAPDHWLLRLSAGTTTDRAKAASASLRTDQRFTFVSNVFKTRNGGDDIIPLNRLTVNFKPSVSKSRQDSLISAFGLTVVRTPRPDSGFTYFVLAYPRDSVSFLRVAALLDRNPLVAWADPDKISNRHPDDVPTDPYYPLQYYLKDTVVMHGVTVDDNVEPAWDLTTGQWDPATGGLRVGVIGMGIDAAHPDFDGRILAGYDALYCQPGCTDDETHPFPGDSHETLVAGLIVSHHNNNGVAGIAPGVYIVSARIFRGCSAFCDSVASDQGIADAINFLWDWKSALVINNSWGGGAPSNAITSAIQAANSQGHGGLGTVVVFSAGNTSNRDGNFIGAVQYPATLPEVVAVGAIDRNGNLTNYSPEGSELDIVAPSGHYTSRCVGDVTTTDLTDGTGCNDGPNGDNLYSTTFSGTSAAAPQVSAVAALVISRTQFASASFVKGKLYGGAVPWGSATQYGAGKLNAFASVTNVTVTVNGPVTIKRAGNYSWSASAGGGNGSYAYTWERSADGGPFYWVGSDVTYGEFIDTNSPDNITLRVTVVSGTESGQGSKDVHNLIVP